MGDNPDDVDIDIEEAEYPVKKLFETFALPPARYTVGYLLDAESASLGQLAESVTEIQHSHSAGGEGRRDQEEMKQALYHVFLPLLADVGIVEFNTDDRTVELNPDAEATRVFRALLHTLNHTGSLTQ